MAIKGLLKDTNILGSLRATDTIYGTTGQFTTLKIPTASNGTTYSAGTSGQVIKTNGTSIYWANDNNTVDLNSMTGILSLGKGGTGAIDAAGARTNLGLGSIAVKAETDYKKIISGTKQISTTGWYRILDCTVSGTSFLVTFHGIYNNNRPTPVTFLISHSYGYTKISQIGGCSYVGWVTKIRAIHKDSTEFYIDFYFEGTANNTIAYEITFLDSRARDSITKIDFTSMGDLTANAYCDTTEGSYADLADIASKATSDEDGNAIKTTYIKNSVLSGAYDIMYSSSANTPTRLGANTTNTKKFLSMTGTGSAGAAPTWSTVSQSDVGLGNVENTALSTWAGSSNITTIGTLSSGSVPWARLTNIGIASTSALGCVKMATSSGLNINSTTGVLTLSSSFTFNSSNILTAITRSSITCDIADGSWTWRDT